MNRILRDNFPHKTPSLSVRKIGSLSIPVVISMAMMYCSDKVNHILQDKKPETVQVFPQTTLEEAEKIAAGWEDAGEDQVLKDYPVKKGNTLSQTAQKHAKQNTQKDISNTIGNKLLTMTFEGFSPRMQKDTINKTTYFIGYGTDVGTLKDNYPFASYGGEVAHYFREKGYSTGDIKSIMHGEASISKSQGKALFDMRYAPRYQKLKAHCGKQWNTYPSVIQNMLIDMSYNLKGEYGIFPNGSLYPGFPDAVSALNRGDWVRFINEVADSDYAQDVGPRRLGTLIHLIVGGLLHGKTSGLSPAALKILKSYTAHYKGDIESLMAKAG